MKSHAKNIIFYIILLLFLWPPKSINCKSSPQGTQQSFYLNPIFSGDYPDPSIIREGNDYYVVHSSFEYYPGLLIWHSQDLINWTPVANALHTYVGSVWAPDLVKYQDKYYIYFPANNTNYVVTADSLTGPWSEPIDLQIGNIDPGHVVDSNGNRYLYFSNGSYVSLSEDGLSVMGELTHVYDGWPIPREWTVECFCMEGPKLTKRGDYFYLTVAEGGTSGPPTGHMVISARSESPLGPWENSPYNPILRTEHKSEKWWSVGHGTIFDDASGKWWIIFHGYENGHYNMGRQTLLLPIEWTSNDWYKIPEGMEITDPIKPPSGIYRDAEFSLDDCFAGHELKTHWKFFGEYDTNRFYLKDSNLVLQGKGNNIGESSPLLTIPEDHSYMAQVELSIEGDVLGGLVLFYNSDAYSGILTDGENILTNLRGWQFQTEKNVAEKHLFLRLRNINNTVDMYYSLDGNQWIKTQNSLEVSAYHHNVLGGFLSLRIGLCAIGDGTVKFENFEYTPVK